MLGCPDTVHLLFENDGSWRWCPLKLLWELEVELEFGRGFAMCVQIGRIIVGMLPAGLSPTDSVVLLCTVGRTWARR